MPFPVLGLVLLAGVAAAAGAALLTRKSPPPAPQDGRVGRFVGLLRKGQLYRVWARVSPPIPRADLQTAVERMGFGDVKLITPDPTDAQVATILARWMLDSSETFDTQQVHLFQLQAVEEPPPSAKTSGSADIPHPSLDGGLTAEDADAIRWALLHDDDAKHLGGFAKTFEPDFPIAAGLLRAKAALANERSMGSVLAAERRAKHEKMFERFLRAAAEVNVAEGAAEWAKRMVPDTLASLKRLTEGLVPVGTWDRYKPSSDLFIPAHRMWMLDKALSILKQVKDAPRDIGEEGEEYAKKICESCPAIALVPGLGSGVACMRAAGAALSLATALEWVDMKGTEACLGESEGVAFATGASFIGEFARGKVAPAEGLFATLTKEREAMNETEKVAFDAGIALGFARALQATDFPSLWPYVQGDSLTTRALAFAVAVGQAKREGKRVVPLLLGKLASALPAASLSQVRKLVVDLIEDGNLLGLYPTELAKKKNVPAAVAQAALAVVREVGEGVRIVDPKALRLIFPNEQSFDLGLTPAALKLAMSTTKPYMSQVVEPANIVPKVRAIAKDTSPDGEKARRQLERAIKTLERRRWSEWYRKVRGDRKNVDQSGVGGMLTGTGA